MFLLSLFLLISNLFYFIFDSNFLNKISIFFMKLKLNFFFVLLESKNKKLHIFKIKIDMKSRKFKFLKESKTQPRTSQTRMLSHLTRNSKNLKFDPHDRMKSLTNGTLLFFVLNYFRGNNNSFNKTNQCQ